MKRHGNLYEKFCTKANFELAEANARKCKESKSYVKEFDRDREGNIDRLYDLHVSGAFRTSEYRRKVIKEKKTRVLGILPYNPDRVTQHAIINVMRPIWIPYFTTDTYSNIKGHGLHQCVEALKKTLHTDPEGTMYCLQTDLVQHYPMMRHDVLKEVLRRKVKDGRMLGVMDEIIDSIDGLPLGNPISGYLENMALTPFDHKVKEVYKVKHYYRLVDDMLFFGATSEELHELFPKVKADLAAKGMVIKANWQIYKVDSRGVDFLGYRFFHGYTLLRKSIKQNIFRRIGEYGRGEVTEERFNQSMASWTGWMQWCDSYRLQKKIEQSIKQAKQTRERIFS